MQTKKTKIFISKSLDDLNLLPDYCEQNSLLLTAHSFLSFSEVDFTIDSGFDVVFFSSPRSAYYFLTKVKLNKHIEIAVAGETTKIMVESFGYPVSFFPEKSGDIRTSSLVFANWVKNKPVLFPTSNLSLKSYTKHLKNYNSIEVYKTSIQSKQVEDSDIYVFSSPSNVEGFFMENQLRNDSKVIAWGESTQITLKDQTNHPVYTLANSSEIELLKTLDALY